MTVASQPGNTGRSTGKGQSREGTGDVGGVPPSTDSGRLLAACHGYLVATSDGLLGEVETPIFPPNALDPDYIVVRVGGRPSRLPIIPTALVTEVNAERRLVRLQGTREELARLPEHLPLDR